MKKQLEIEAKRNKLNAKARKLDETEHEKTSSSKRIIKGVDFYT